MGAMCLGKLPFLQKAKDVKNSDYLKASKKKKKLSICLCMYFLNSAVRPLNTATMSSSPL